jgi:hypothetical protein
MGLEWRFAKLSQVELASPICWLALTCDPIDANVWSAELPNTKIGVDSADKDHLVA